MLNYCFYNHHSNTIQFELTFLQLFYLFILINKSNNKSPLLVYKEVQPMRDTTHNRKLFQYWNDLMNKVEQKMNVFATSIKIHLSLLNQIRQDVETEYTEMCADSQQYCVKQEMIFIACERLII